ncbi:MAG: domain S-box protein, partial [Proteobacteria bacterium]|nr:domain S-box protein [Pseudomonadota bacterium]
MRRKKGQRDFEVPPKNSATGNLVKSVFEKENGLEEAVFRRAD